MESKTFVLHDSSLNTHGFRMLTSGADLSVFRSNPVMLLNHDDWNLPIGRWENIRIEGDQILADAVFDEDDKRAAEIAGKVERGFIKSASVAGWKTELSDDPSTWLPGQRDATVTKWVVKEASICSVGANHNAIVLYDENDKVIDLSKSGALLSLCDRTGKNETVLNQNNLKMNYLKKLFKLSDAASEEAVSDAAEGVLNENKTLKAANEALEAENKRLKEKVETADREKTGNEQKEAAALVDQAIKDARISASGRDAWLADFKNDFENAKVRLSSISARTSIASQVQAGAESEFVKLSWDELDKQGKLVRLKETDPALFAQKYKERFGVEPKV